MEPNEDLYMYFCILDLDEWIKVYIKDLNCEQLGTIKEYQHGCLVCKGEAINHRPVILSISHEGIYCGIDVSERKSISKIILSSNKKFLVTMEKIISIYNRYKRNELINCDPSLAVTTVYLYDNKDLRKLTVKDVCVECEERLVEIGNETQKWVCTNPKCRYIYKMDKNGFKKTKKRMSSGPFKKISK